MFDDGTDWDNWDEARARELTTHTGGGLVLLHKMHLGQALCTIDNLRADNERLKDKLNRVQNIISEDSDDENSKDLIKFDYKAMDSKELEKLTHRIFEEIEPYVSGFYSVGVQADGFHIYIDTETMLDQHFPVSFLGHHVTITKITKARPARSQEKA